MISGNIDLIRLPTKDARPYGIVVDNSFTPWFTEFGTNRLGMIVSKSKTVREMLLFRREARPRRLAVTSNNAIWYVDYAEGYLGQFISTSGKVEEWALPGGQDSRPYGMTADDQDRVWLVETGVSPNRLIGFHSRIKQVISITPIKSGGGTVRHMFYHQPSQTIWFGTDANTIGRAKLP